VSPTDQEEIAAGITRLLLDSALRAELVRRGFRHSAGFSWDRCARETLAVYESV
jgi:glycosyltransferase involved in cell wall biosynthesis